MWKKNISGKLLLILIFLSFCIALNYYGRVFATAFQLPLWLDSIGTGLSAAIISPVCGAISGSVCNILFGFQSADEYAYILTSIVIGVVIGVCVKKGFFRSFFGAMTVGVIVTFSTVLISTPLNIFFSKGRPGNAFGDALFDLLRLKGVPVLAASFLGDLFIDFPDKILTVLLTYLILQIPHLKKAMDRKYFLRRIRSLLLLITIFSTILPMTISSPEEAAALQLLSVPTGVPVTDQNKKESASLFSSQYAQQIYNSENGLASGEVNAISGTKDGSLYFGTYSGLYRYDGRTFSLVKLDSVKNVNCLYTDKKDRLWIGTNDSGLTVLQDGKIVNCFDKARKLPSNSIRCFLDDGNGSTYVGTSAHLCIFSDQGGITLVKAFSQINYASDITISPDGTIAVITNAGMLAFLKNQEIIATYTLEMDNLHYTSCEFIGTELLLGTSSNKLLTWNFDKQEPDTENMMDTGNLTNIHEVKSDSDNNVTWLCADNGIGYITEKGKLILLNTGSFNSSIEGIAQDYQGNIWFTSSRLGAMKLTKSAFTDIYSQYGLSAKVVNSITKWEGKLYTGTDLGLDIMDTETVKFIQNDLTELLKNHRIRCLMVDSRNHLWIATSDGTGLLDVSPEGRVITYNRKNGTIGDRFRSVIEHSDGTIIAAENTGIDFIRNGVVVATIGVNEGLSNPQILSLYEKDKDTLFAGSDGDGLMIIKEGKVVQRVNDGEGLPSGVILRILPLNEGYLLVTSNSICYMNPNYHVKELQNFPYSNNFDAFEDNRGNIWVLGSAGIYIVNKQQLISGNELWYELLDSRKGLSSSLVANSWNYRNGDTLYLCCSTGVFSIDMNNYNIYKGTYKIRIEYLDVNGESLPVLEGNKVVIPKDVSRIRIRPELLNYTLNDPSVHISLQGYDTEEYKLTQNSLMDLVYSNLPSGTYVFRMNVYDSSDEYVIQSESFMIEKLPQLYESKLFIIYLVFVCILATVYLTWLLAVIRSSKVIARQKQEIEQAIRQAEIGNETILAIAKTVDAKDVNTSEHSERVSEYSVLIAQKLQWSKEKCDNLRQIALLHDIGKVGIPDSILNKPARLTEEEYAVMKTHVKIGSDILKGFTVVDHVQDGVRYHHERFDGSGYMEGLKGEEIPEDARIIGIADAFDAMTSNRVYRKKMDISYVIEELKKGSGTQFDPRLVDIMLELIDEGSIEVAKKSDAV